MSLPPYRPLIEDRISEVTPATTAEVTDALDGPVSADTALVLLRGLAAEDADIALIRSGIERLAAALEDYAPSQNDRIHSRGMLYGQGAPEHLLRALDALDAGDAGWAMQHLDNAYRTHTRPIALEIP